MRSCLVLLLFKLLRLLLCIGNCIVVAGLAIMNTWWYRTSLLIVILNYSSLFTSVNADANICTFGGRTYNVGDVWHPKLQAHSIAYCVTCQCNKTKGERDAWPDCKSKECGEKCEDISDVCCKICKGNTTELTSRKQSSIMGNKFIPSKRTNCIHEGQKYQEGQKFNSNSTIIRASGPEECVQCQCQNGVVVCDVVQCSRTSSRSSSNILTDTCPDCPSITTISRPTASMPAIPATFETSLNLPIWFGVKNKRGKSCISGGKQYMEGESWNPVIGPLGPMLCVVCQCKSSRIECSRFACPEKLACSKPVRIPGQCCDSCPSSTPTAQTLAVQPPPQRGAAVGSHLCMPPGKNISVYKAKGPLPNIKGQPINKNDTGIGLIQFAFAPPNPTNNVELHTWRLIRNVVDSFETQHVAAQNFRLIILEYRFVLLGATTTDLIEKFTRREKKLRKRCRANCGSKLEKLPQQLLQLKKITERSSNCLPGEIEL